ncbi:MAG: ribosome biogenesis GTPase Der [Pseudomonadota bacterium]
MIPVVALVGRPNVGKSTLFNRLTKSRDALVANLPGLTRDRQYGKAEYRGQPYLVVDTGGITGEESGIDLEMAKQSLQAAAEADVIFFMVDGKAGINSIDRTLAEQLRSYNRPCHLVVNKSDGVALDDILSDCYELGLGEPSLIAAVHGRGVKELIRQVMDDKIDLTDEESSIEKPLQDSKSIKLAVIGRPNVGKSTLINRILGEERVVVFDQPGTTRDSIYIDMEKQGKHYTLIDTAGVRRRAKVKETVEKFSVVKTLQAIEDSHVVIWIIDAREGVTEQDLTILSFAIESGKGIVFAINKWDGLSSDDRDSVKEELARRLVFIDYARHHFISAKHGTGVGHLFESVHESYDNAMRDISTNVITKSLEKAQEIHQPPLIKGRRVKLRYAHLGGHNPPIVVVHGSQVESLPDSYTRYLMNHFRKSLKLMGTPIRIQYKEGDNPYKDKKNVLTDRQIRRKKRLMKFVKRR